MKCVQNTANGNVIRLSDIEAEKLVKTGGWKYCPKRKWKARMGK